MIRKPSNNKQQQANQSSVIYPYRDNQKESTESLNTTETSTYTDVQYDYIDRFIERKQEVLAQAKQRFNALIDEYVEEEIARQQGISEHELQEVLAIEVPPYIDYHEEMRKLGYPNIYPGCLEVVPDLDYMANHYLQAWEYAFDSLLEDSGYRKEEFAKVLDYYYSDVRQIATEFFLENQRTDPRLLVLKAYSVIKDSFLEYGERYQEEKEKVYKFVNNPNNTGKRRKNNE